VKDGSLETDLGQDQQSQQLEGISLSMSDQGLVTVTFQDHILHMHVDRAAKRNAFTPHMLQEIGRAFKRLDEDPEAWVGLLTFAGAHTTSGLDLPAFLPAMQSGTPIFDDTMLDPHALERPCRKPVVCAVQGVTYTIGIELMLACDITVAASDAKFSQLEPARGITPMGGATLRFVDRAGWGNAMYHLLRCDVFDAQRAKEIGFVQEVVEPNRQVERALEIAAEIARNAPLAIQAAKKAAWDAVMINARAGVDQLVPNQMALMQTADAMEGAMAFMHRRPAEFKGR
jgi:enoyl-CoA hydratase/carnithine racemase